MTKEQNRCPLYRLVRPLVFVTLCCSAVLSIAPDLQATITWSGGTNTVLADQLPHDASIIITGGTNTVQGAAGPPAGTNAGMLQVDSGGGSGLLQITGATVTLNSDPTKPGILSLMGNVTSHASAVTSVFASGGNAAALGTVDSSTGTRTFTVESGSVPGGGPDLSISAAIRNSGIKKEGAGILALSGQNTYTGGTTLNAGKIYINSSTAIGNGPFTVGGSGTAIDNRSGGPLALTNNNQFNLTGGNLTFIGTNDLDLGTGLFILFGAPARTVTVTNAAATLTIGGVIADNGTGVALVKAGAGELVLNAASIYAGGTNVNGGTLFLGAAAETGAGTVGVGLDGTLVVDGKVNGNVSVSGLLGGTGIIQGSLTVNSGGIVDLTGGTLTVNGPIINGSLFILSNGSHLAGVTSFTNNGTLDIISAGTFTPPPNFTNNGVIIDSSVVKVKTVSREGAAVNFTIDSYTGHIYQLRRYSSLTTNAFDDLGSQQGTTGTILTFSDPAPPDPKDFYRIAVDP